jgi:sugar phosphate isomerase/epimerase
MKKGICVMRLSTSTNICEHTLRNYGEFTYTCSESMEMIKDAGFDAADLCFCSYCRGTLPMTLPNWKDWVAGLVENQARLDLPLSQAHAHFYDYEASKDVERDEELVRRSIEAAGILGIPWITVHTQSVRDSFGFSKRKSRELNVKLLNKYGEWAAKYGTALAVENLIERRNGERRYAVQVEELLELVDGMNDSKLFGICWDTGHAHLNKNNQPDALRMVGSRLKAVHIADNKGEFDEHILPYQGTIQWEPIMKALKEIDYKGDFTYEVHEFGNPLPKELRMKALKYACDTGRYLISLYEN